VTGSTTQAPARLAPLTIRLRGLSVYAHHGMHDEERALGQRFEFDLDAELSDAPACRTDDPGDAIEYEALASVIIEVATNFRFQLIEALAEAVSLELLAEFPIERVRLEVAKPAPSMPHSVRSASVVVERTRAHLGADS
jgi:dihydroneopterin aldolase